MDSAVNLLVYKNPFRCGVVVYQVLQGRLAVPGDKSISHRALMFLGLSRGSGTISGLSGGQDVRSTWACMEALGCHIEAQPDGRVFVSAPDSLVTPTHHLDCGNSGTTIRLLAGILAGVNINTTLKGDESLHKRPMNRVITPLREMGARLTGQGEKGFPPLVIHNSPGGLSGIDYTLPMASAQVKSAVLLAGLSVDADDDVCLSEPEASRNHTETMLSGMGVAITQAMAEDGRHLVRLDGRLQDLRPCDILVPGDISSAAFWLVGGAILPGSDLTFENVGLNPTRLGILPVLESVGLTLTRQNERHTVNELYGDLALKSERLSGSLVIEGKMIPSLIDEIPILTILGIFNDGEFHLRDAQELKVKESDRMAAMVTVLKRLNIDVEERKDGYSFHGNSRFKVPRFDENEPFETHHDHRLVMALEILGLRSEHPIPIDGREWVGVSYPSFYRDLEHLQTAKRV